MTINMFPTHDDPIDFVDLVKSISLAEGKYVALDVSGGWKLVDNEDPMAPSIPNIIPLEGSTSVDLTKYANTAIITVDEDWTEETLTEVTTVETGYGISRSITKIGDQLQTISTDLGSGNGIEEEWTWDEDGNLTRYDRNETATLERTTEYTTWAIDSGTGLFTMFEFRIIERKPNPMGSWYYYRRYEKTTTTYLDDNAPVNVEEYTFWYFPEVSEWHYKHWVHRVGLPATPGIIESSRNDYYDYSEADDNWHLQRTLNEGGLTRPEWTKMLQMNKIGMHFSSTATDEPSISYLNAIEQEFAAWGYVDSDTCDDASLNFLIYCQRANVATVEVVATSLVLGQIVKWGLSEWVVEGITHKLDTMTTVLELSREAGIEEVKDVAIGDPQEIGEAFVKILQTKAKRLDNAARGQIIAQIDFETYQVHIQGEPVEKIRTARTDYRRGESFQPGKEVLLVRATGKRNGWEIVTRRNDTPTIMTSVEAPAPPAPALEFYLGRTIYHPTNDHLLLHIGDGYRFEAVWGYEGETVRKYIKVGSEWKLDGSGFDGELQGMDSTGCLRKGVYAPLDPDTYPSQLCEGSIRLMGSSGSWTDWHDFSYYLVAPAVTRFDWTEGTPYAGESSIDVPSALVKDVEFTITCDLRTVVSTEVEIVWSSDGVNWVGIPYPTSTLFKLYGTATAVPITGSYEWQYSADDENWHTTQTISDCYVRISNKDTEEEGITDSVFPFDYSQTNYNSYIQAEDSIYFYSEVGYPEQHYWFRGDDDNEKDENGNFVFTREYRLGYDGPNGPLGVEGTETYGPPYPGETAEFYPRLRLFSACVWQDPSAE